MQKVKIIKGKFEGKNAEIVCMNDGRLSTVKQYLVKIIDEHGKEPVIQEWFKPEEIEFLRPLQDESVRFCTPEELQGNNFRDN